ncbi:DUF2552 family protein [Ectobacillus sp. sgz5001026]|uniref:DUF2552 family protein n=1 Tax=Ectobacillus sp. sgz5001026 TaxID=3242473 RepID=UPI0036D34666
MNETYEKMKEIAMERTWVSFLNENHPYTLLQWSVSSMTEHRDVWLLQNEVTFETETFSNVEEAMKFIIQNMPCITDIHIK